VSSVIYEPKGRAREYAPLADDLFERTEEFVACLPAVFLENDPWLRTAMGLLNEYWAQENERRKQAARDAEAGPAA